MKIAVLGANGFIGSYLCTYLWTRNHEVLPITRKDLDLTDKDIVSVWL
jgi:dTDP-4-dehydrorhamnose reductase